MLDKKSKLPIAFKDVIIVAAGVLIVLAVMYAVLGTRNPFYVVSSGSMEPVLMVNDVLVVRGGEYEELKVGDIIVFNRPEGGDRVIVHRIAEIISQSDGDRVIRTKGDANPSSIPGTDFPIREGDFIGEVVYVVPGIGLVTKVISPPVNYIIIAIILAILFFNRMGGKKEKDKNDNTAPADPSGQPPADPSGKPPADPSGQPPADPSGKPPAA